MGRQREIDGSRMYIKGYWLTAFFIPLLPLCFYVITREGAGYRFHAQMSVRDFIVLYRWRAITYYLGVWLESALWLSAFAGALAIAYGVAVLIRAMFA